MSAGVALAERVVDAARNVRAQLTLNAYRGEAPTTDDWTSKAHDDPWRRIDQWRRIQWLVREGQEGEALTRITSLLAEIKPEARGPGYGSELVLALDLAARQGRQERIPEWLAQHGHRFASEPFLLEIALCLPAVAAVIVKGELRETLGLSSQDLDDALSELDRSLTAALAPRSPLKQAIADAENALLLRTDFSDEAAWRALCASIQAPVGEFRAHVSCVSDRALDGATVEQIVPLAMDAGHSFAFVADRAALTDPERAVLVVDLHEEPGRTFRMIPSEAWGIENNLSIANMGFEEFADAVDRDGVFRGFPNT
jgi:hypothetical protein